MKKTRFVRMEQTRKTRHIMPMPIWKYAVIKVRRTYAFHVAHDIPIPTLKPTDSRPVLPWTEGLAYAPYAL